MTTLNTEGMKAKDFTTAFETRDVTQYLDVKSIKARHVMQQISIGFPKRESI